jgi:hypothetical protein
VETRDERLGTVLGKIERRKPVIVEEGLEGRKNYVWVSM